MNLKESLIKSIAALFLAVVILFGIGRPTPVRAQLIVSDIEATVQRQISRLWDVIKDSKKEFGGLVFDQIIGKMVQQYAYDVARYIATGDKGQSPLLTGNLRAHLEKTSDAAFGDYLDSMSREVWGRSLCDQGPLFKAQLTIFLKQLDRPKDITSKCSLSKISQNIKKYRSKFDEQGLRGIAEFNATLEPGASEFGALLTGLTDAETAKQRREKSEEFAKSVEGEFESVKTKITGETETPAVEVEAASKSKLSKILESSQVYTGSFLADTSKIFFNALLSEWLKKTFQEGIVDPALYAGSGALGPGGNVGRAKKYFSSVQNIQFGIGKEMNLLSELSSQKILDDGMKQAVMNNKTVGQALLDSDLHKDWPLGFFGNISQGQEPVFVQGYGYSNLVQLRKNRIIPIGWEMAALKIKELGTSRTLQNVVECFEDPSDPKNKSKPESCLVDGVNPFYRLIDPDWVFTSHPTYCSKEGYVNYGSQIEGASAPTNDIRQKTCIDSKSCLQKDGNGNCVSYGYCAEDRNVYGLKADQCEEEFASCASYKDSGGQTVAYLKKTLDTSGCVSGSEGCSWLCSEATETSWKCDNKFPYENKVFFDQDLKTCAPENEGCSLVIDRGGNLAPNGSFELVHGSEEFADGWRMTLDPKSEEIPTSSSESLDGSRSIILSGSENISSAEISILNSLPLQYRPFYLSFSVKSKNECEMTAAFGSSKGEDFSEEIKGKAGNEWRTFSSQYIFKTIQSGLSVKFNRGNCAEVFVDQVRFSENKSSVSQEYGDEENQIFMKLNKVCRGGLNDGQSCYSDAQCPGDNIKCEVKASCSQQDAGCQWYRPIDGSDPVPGQINPSADPNDPNDSCSKENGDKIRPYTGAACNVCPNDKMGCQSFFRSGSNLFFPDPSKHESRQAGQVNFIGTSGKSCSAAEIFCEEYTNLDEVERGGEGRESYSSLRACVKPEQLGVETYYRWVGDDLLGYQLVSEELLSNPNTRAPCSHAAMTKTGEVSCDDQNHPDPSSLDCRTVFNQDPKCVEYFNNSGNGFYRYRDKTIIASNDCHPLRNTLDDQIYMAIPKESKSCSFQNIGCREYKGSAGYNIQVLLKEDFNDGNVWEAFKGTSLSSINTPLLTGLSMQVASQGGEFTGEAIVQKDVTDRLLEKDGKLKQSYVLRFWASSLEGAPLMSARLTNDSEVFGETKIIQGWHEYVLGPLAIDRVKASKELLRIVLPNLSSGQSVLIDELSFEENGNLYAIHDSYEGCGDEFVGCRGFVNAKDESIGIKSFKKVCDESSIGCSQLINSQNSSYPFEKSYDQGLYLGESVNQAKVPEDSILFAAPSQENLCDPVHKGCRAYGKPMFKAEETAPTYLTTTVIDDPDSYDLLPGGILCKAEAFQCQSYEPDSAQGSAVLFKDPGEQVCEFREGQVSETTGWYKRGTESEIPNCPVKYPARFGTPTGKSCVEVCVNGVNDGKSCAIDANCPGGECGLFRNSSEKIGNPCVKDIDCGTGLVTGLACQYWAGSCPVGANQCAQFIEPAGLNNENMLLNGDFSVKRFLGDPTAPDKYPEYWEPFSGEPVIKYVQTDGEAKDVLQVKFVSEPNGSILGQADVSLEPFSTYKIAVRLRHEKNINTGFRIMLDDCKDQFGNTFGSIQTDDKIGLESVDGTMVGSNDETGSRPFDEMNLIKTFDDKQSGIPLSEYQWIEGRFYSGHARQCDVGFGFLTGDNSKAGWVDAIELKKIDDSYFLNNDRIDAASCNQTIDIGDNCLLFNNTDDSKTASFTYPSYESSTGSPEKGLCDPDYYPELCNANTVLKVNRDRTCQSWLSCTTSQKIFNQTTGQFEQICYDLGRCIALGPTGECAEWESPNNEPLTTQAYQEREGYSGNETGYSIPSMYDLTLLHQEKYPIIRDKTTKCSEDLDCLSNERCEPVNLEDPKSDSYCVQYEVNLTRLSRTCEGGEKNGEICASNRDCGERGACTGGIKEMGAAGQECGSENECPFGQICRKKCPDNDRSCDYNTGGYCVIPKICRAYPTVDSPWPSSVQTGRNLCVRRKDGKGFDCECSYQKATYSSGVERFVSVDAIPSESCEYSNENLGGAAPEVSQSLSCLPKEFPKTMKGPETEIPGQPSQTQLFDLTKQEKFMGFGGFCLDYNHQVVVNGDESKRACVTNLPIEGILDEVNPLSRDPGSEYRPSSTQEFYCLGELTSKGSGTVPLISFEGPYKEDGTTKYTNIGCENKTKCEETPSGHWCVAPTDGSMIGSYFEVSGAGDRPTKPPTALNDTLHWNYTGDEIKEKSIIEIVIEIQSQKTIRSNTSTGCGQDGEDDGWFLPGESGSFNVVIPITGQPSAAPGEDRIYVSDRGAGCFDDFRVTCSIPKLTEIKPGWDPIERYSYCDKGTLCGQGEGTCSRVVCEGEKIGQGQIEAKAIFTSSGKLKHIAISSWDAGDGFQGSGTNYPVPPAPSSSPKWSKGSGAFKIAGINALQNVSSDTISINDPRLWAGHNSAEFPINRTSGDKITISTNCDGRDQCEDWGAGSVCEVGSDFQDKKLFTRYWEIADDGKTKELCYQYVGKESGVPGAIDFHDYDIQEMNFAIQSQRDVGGSGQGCGGDDNDDGWYHDSDLKWRTIKNPENGAKVWGESISHNYNDEGEISWRATFNAQTSLLEYVCFQAEDKSDSGAFGIRDITITPTTSCNLIADITPGDTDRSYAYTDRIDDGKEGDNGQEFKVDSIAFEDECLPYGAIGSDPIPSDRKVNAPDNPVIKTKGCYDAMTFSDYKDENQLANNLFSHFDFFTFDQSNFTYTAPHTFDLKNQGLCPVIKAAVIDGGQYSEKGNPQNCEGEIAVNGKNENQDIQGRGFVSAFIDFFAYNDNGNQMPIRTIEIDWKDGTSVQKFEGVYSNRREQCDGKKFGDRVGSCREEPFSFFHTYSSPGEYKPKVTVTDNWGKSSEGFMNGTITVQ